MNKDLYSELAEVCHAFYEQYFPHEKIATNLNRILKKYHCKKIVFIGGLIDVAKILHKKGYDITLVDYTPEMISRAKRRLAGVRMVLSDMRELRLKTKYDAILAIGRSFTYMYTDQDALKTLKAFRQNLKTHGIVIVDNYEIGKIDKGSYFNGMLRAGSIKRYSTLKKIKKHPALYRWNCVYEQKKRGKTPRFRDNNHFLRAFSKKEIRGLLEKSGLHFIAHLPNFEKKSFITVIQRKV